MALPWNNLSQDLFISLLLPLLCVLAASVLILKSLCLYGASYQDNWVLRRLLHACYINNFAVEGSYYTTEICLVLHYCFVKETAPKCGCLVHFFGTSLLIMHACMHAHPRSLRKKNNLLIDRFAQKRSQPFIQVKRSIVWWFFAFNAVLWAFKSLCFGFNILVVNDVANCVWQTAGILRA